MSFALKNHDTSQIVIKHFFIFNGAICRYNIAYHLLNSISFVNMLSKSRECNGSLIEFLS